ncbi:P-loop containing nucleoside triphosphate hydrolase protein [Pyrenochaeta sp. MPI-SDFR-AT-0127]|nr:P-loop containing nucleoside triphosphate hydrolase protein [Pyrenochaeta sp. MPI-SDFR-AT-0127]
MNFEHSNLGFQAGVINGPVHPIFHPAEKRPETPPRPSCNVPFRRDPLFVDRRALIQDIERRCSEPASRVALVGLGGVGKSQLAIEHCYRTFERSPETWVFWARAGDSHDLEQSFEDIADNLKLYRRGQPQTNVFKLVCDWLRNFKNGKWLLVLDNFTTAEAIGAQSSTASAKGAIDSCRLLLKYLPQSNNGSLLLTSRVMHDASELVEESDILIIGSMNADEGQQLLLNRLKRPVDEDDIRELAIQLDHFPFALLQVAAYINKSEPEFLVRKYLDDLKQNDAKVTSLMTFTIRDLRRDRDGRNTILSIWQDSFERLRCEHPSAVDFLALASISDSHCTRSSANEVLILKDYCLGISENEPNSLSSNRLVRLAIQEWLRNDGQLDQWRSFLATSAQISSSISRDGNAQANDEDATRNGEAGKVFARTWSFIKERLPPEGVHSLDLEQRIWKILDFWATVRQKQERWTEMEELLSRKLQGQGRRLGQMSSVTLESKCYLCDCYIRRKQWTDAKEMACDLLRNRQAQLGAEHSMTLEVEARLAWVYHNLKRHEESEAIFNRMLDLQDRIQAEITPFVLQYLHTILSQSHSHGCSKLVASLSSKHLRYWARTHGKEHSDTLDAMQLHTMCLCVVGNNAEALVEAENYLTLQTRLQGRESLQTLRVMHLVGWICTTIPEQYDRASVVLEECLEARTRLLKRDNLETVSTLYLYNIALWRLRAFEKALPLAKECWELKTQLQGTEHEETLGAMLFYGRMLLKVQGNVKASVLLKACFHICARVRGRDDVLTLHAMYEYAKTLHSQRQMAESFALLEECMKRQPRVLGLMILQPEGLVSGEALRACLTSYIYPF